MRKFDLKLREAMGESHAPVLTSCRIVPLYNSRGEKESVGIVQLMACSLFSSL